jgi:hypothetical protein
MSLIHVGGPTLFSVGTGESGAAEFLGFCEGITTISVDSGWEDVMTDYGGTKIPADVQFMGEQAFITADLVRYNENILNKLRARAFDNLTGTVAENLMGSLMVGQGQSQKLSLVCPYSAITHFSGSQNSGYTFGAAWLADAITLETGTRYARVRCIWRCVPVWDWVANSATLYTNTATGATPN